MQLAAGVIGQVLTGLALAQTGLSLEQVRALPPLPAVYAEEPSLDARLLWLQQRLASPLDAAERYRSLRLLFNEYYDAHRLSDAATVCQQHPPLPDDMLFRAHCLLAAASKPEEQLPQLLALVSEARSRGNRSMAASLLKDIAWLQSQLGDIGGAFENLEAALAEAPTDDVALLTDLMMDTATSYIVNGDEGYIRKGIALLSSNRERLERALGDAPIGIDKTVLRENIQLTEFNRGIAYALHLSEYANALQHFDRVLTEPNPYVEDALAFAALAAAELHQYERARAYLARAAREASSNSGPVVQQYLSCYRQLATRHWHPAQGVNACLNLHRDTATEVQLDIYKRLSQIDDQAIAMAGLKGLKTLFIEKLEPQLRRRGSTAASNAELRRLQRESDLKSIVLQQQAALQSERDATNAQRQNYFIALSLLLLSVVLLIALSWRSKKTLAEQFERLSLVDTLTQLGNRRYLEQHINRELAHLARARRRNADAALGVYLFDVDHFKSVNDRFGHGVGDEVLVELARRIQAVTRDTDLLVRWGGEEFLLVARLDGEAHGRQVATRILQAINDTPFVLSTGDPLPVTCTIGALCLPFVAGSDSDLWTELVGLADLALYEGKRTGRNRCVMLQNRGLTTNDAVKQALQMPLQASVGAGLLGLSSSADASG
ncbi:MAG: GGDEF domain-containing protein [Burkholderiales bacterium]|nr:GGDEF domain-containing protein [Burkholderiales bacterium]